MGHGGVVLVDSSDRPSALIDEQRALRVHWIHLLASPDPFWSAGGPAVQAYRPTGEVSATAAP
jgi:hypothetical protein